MNTPAKSCLNCQTPLRGFYCSSCGQKASVGRLSIFSVLTDFYGAFTNTERGFLKTVVDLTFRPSQMLHNYLDGRRIQYFPAGKFVLLMIVLFTLSLSALEDHFAMFENLTRVVEKNFSLKIDKSNNGSSNSKKNAPSEDTEKSRDEDADPAEEKIFKFKVDVPFVKGVVSKDVTQSQWKAAMPRLIAEYHRLFFDYLRLISILWIPIFAFFSYVLFFKFRNNLAEHLVLNSYLYAQSLFIFIVLSPLFWIFPQHSWSTLMLITLSTLSFLFFAFMEFFKGQGRSAFKCICLLAFGTLTYGLTLLCASLTLGLVIAYQSV